MKKILTITSISNEYTDEKYQSFIHEKSLCKNPIGSDTNGYGAVVLTSDTVVIFTELDNITRGVYYLKIIVDGEVKEIVNVCKVMR